MAPFQFSCDNMDGGIVSVTSQRMDFGYDSTAFQNIEMVQISSHPITKLKKSGANLGETCIRGFNFKDAKFTKNIWLYGSNVLDIMMFLRLFYRLYVILAS
ncbi:P-type ATPase, HAD-like domain protein [Artemisia annua]|uniref:P-type ATPase, HAD-like domain protein n=1 Tax=Artemisia annua TaxID=35608 RepID=A0A2U1MA52_ARTAN|nr:P-type ATPase, HAD-like domain protein [Artemisia annua]